MRFRVVVALIALFVTATLFAQSDEIGGFVNRSSFSSDSQTDPLTGVMANIKFDSKAGYGIAFTHFLSPTTAIELSGQTVHGIAKVQIATGGMTSPESGGKLDLKQYGAALHWYLVPQGTFRPYVGAGVAWIRSGKLSIAADTADAIVPAILTLQNKVTWVADAGIDIHISQGATLTLSGKYAHYTATLPTTPDNPDNLFQRLRLNPVTIQAGLRFKF
jgi:outer membrane protein W